ncbi:aminotransferase class I/II-fold pyridoxal phosphate-dependent enzyme [Methanocorpusculum vombati]|uniref:Aminotransferase n=1 Tax=Methanocorpusculum vombati TaxID=3002864 RepID=A0ABT4IKR3_9EURY|nr:aminotransferase class I/II-fold pyridoxal phosphate-dependent enzyme [Methanocorpusculum vombati]MCZ9319152.1 aminotransferase class I/II-fold pyridoxal phosphate-dependent enzyme [Methanocorpusculum sp.]MCZ0861735.1 aminotransferase class I/II-fold pyridoxal phosphate-dependent enzyme [Methanocorpusculum vombati]MDE2521295.1 aminotransferase class I/II-fold pyridoxal phosphate-dependent enzyme [Methanocorpusculum sp.]MDE2535032.1 aminotransferase class I/II-fold pyridoxal phosphate-depende
MRSFVSRMAAEIPPSGIRKFFDLLLTMDNVISLGVGEPDFDTPWNISQAAIASIEKGMTMYTSNRGLAELRELLAADLDRRYHTKYCPETEMIVTSGVSEALDVAVRAVVDPGDEVLVVDPCFVSYQPEVLMAGGRPKALPCRAEDQFKVTPEALMESVTPKTKVLMINFPNNPTGGVMGADDLKAIADIVIDHDLLVISDEVYAELTYDGHHVSTAAIDGLWDRTITLNGFSKAYAMTGWRLGYVCAPKEICDAALKIHQYVMMSAPTAAQFAAIEALKNGEDAKNEMVAEYRMRRNLFVKGLNDVGLPCHLPKGAFYAFPSIAGTGLSDEEFAEQLLKEQHVAVVPGSAFGESGRGHVRTCYAVDRSKLSDAVHRIGMFVESLHS